ncbi:SGNH hydrolase, partial [Choiromyces venosus 120613-1]
MKWRYYSSGAAALFAFGMFSAVAAVGVEGKVLMAGDSSMAAWRSADMYQGWGVPLSKYFATDIKNFSGMSRSAAGFIEEGIWDELLLNVKEGDFVIISFGDSDENADNAVDQESVKTYIKDQKRLIADVMRRGAIPVISTMTPQGNVWTPDHKSIIPGSSYKFVDSARKSVAEFGGRVSIIDHYQFVAAAYQKLGYEKVAKLYLGGNGDSDSRTSKEGAETIARAFLNAIRCTQHPLARALNDQGKALEMEC